ncbi:MAG: MFS transporter [Alphaproteobacteria bacterium]
MAAERVDLRPWLVVAVGFAALAASFTARSSLGLAMPTWEAEFGWSRGFVSTVGALALVTMAAAAPISGRMVDRYGPRAFIAAGLALVGVGILATTGMTREWHLLAAFSGLAGLGFGTVAMHVVSTGVAGFFTANRGLALGVATSGATAGQLVLMPAMGSALETAGWRWGFTGLAVLCLALAPVAWLLLGAGRGAAAGRAAQPFAQAAAAPVVAALRARVWLRDPVFHALLWSYVICGFTTSGVIEVHLLPYATACGFPPQQSTTAYGLLMAFNLAGMIAAGWLADRMHRPLLLGIIYIVRGLSFLILVDIVGDLPRLLVFAVVFGLFDYATVPVTASLVASHLGLRVMGLIMGVLAAGHALGAALGAFLAGVLYDLFAQYLWVWLAALVLAIGAGIVSFTIRERRSGAPVAAAA